MLDKPINQLENVSAYLREHPRNFEANRYIYPVVSRRARGVSIGINLNPDKRCNFSCIYCQVDRSVMPGHVSVDLVRLHDELQDMLGYVTSEGLFVHPSFLHLPGELRRVNDVAFSGDGEPTACPQFAEAVGLAAQLRRNRSLLTLKLVLITNASLLDRPRVQEALEILDANGGEIWAKLDAGTEEYFARVARTHFTLEHVVRNILQTAQKRPVVIQSLFMRIDGQAPPPEEVAAYCGRLEQITAAGGDIKLVQVYTIARKPADPAVTALARTELDLIAEEVRTRTGLAVAVFGAEG